jgi:hypothetical protein
MARKVYTKTTLCSPFTEKDSEETAFEACQLAKNFQQVMECNRKYSTEITQ